MTTMELIERGIGHNCLSDAYELGRADALEDTELFREIFLEELVNQSVDREEAIMYRDICTMSWNKYLNQLKEQNNE